MPSVFLYNTLTLLALVLAIGLVVDEQLVSRFARHDAELLARQQAIAHDESQLMQSSRESRAELAQILEEARSAFARKERGAQRAA